MRPLIAGSQIAFRLPLKVKTIARVDAVAPGLTVITMDRDGAGFPSLNSAAVAEPPAFTENTISSQLFWEKAPSEKKGFVKGQLCAASWPQRTNTGIKPSSLMSGSSVSNSPPVGQRLNRIPYVAVSEWLL